MKRNRTLFIITLILILLTAIPAFLAAFEQRITPPGVVFDYKSRELKAPPQIASKLTQLRSRIAAQKLTFEVGYTAAMDVDLAKIAALKVPSNLPEMVRSQNAVALKRLRELPAINPVCSATASSFDWRAKGGSTPVKDQGYCGSCWIFATLGAFEGSWSLVNNQTINASEQDILDCSKVGSCGGGWTGFQYLISNGVSTETSYPYRHADGTCLKSAPRPYKADAWGYVGTDHNIPSVAALKQALCAYGPIWVSVFASEAFQAYKSGVFNENATGGVNHAVTLIGWDDSKQAWLIKNSWGTGWGDTCGYGTERGYMWISYTSNSIGYAAAWVRAHGLVALKAANGMFVSVDNGTGLSLIANRRSAGPGTRFEMLNVSSSLIALKSQANGKFVCAENGGVKPLIANRSLVGGWETFEMVDLGGGKVALKSAANSKFVCADNGGANPLIANRATAGAWETFQKVNMGTGKIALKSLSNGKYISVDNGTAKSLLANRTTAGYAETFEVWNMGANKTALRSVDKGMYVCAEDGGIKPLIANRTAAGPWETFDMVSMGPGKVALKSMANGKFVSAQNAGANPLIATSATAGVWETFEVVNAGY